MSQKKIRLQMKSGAKTLISDPIDAEEAERLLREEVLPKIGKEGAIELPGVVVNAKEVVSAQSYIPPASAMPRVGGRRMLPDQF
jgi:hypothetical protein